MYSPSFILGFLAVLVDAYQEKERSDSSGNVSLCTVLHLHPQLAPVKVAVLSQLPEQNELCEVAQQLSSELREAGGCTHVWVTGVCFWEGVSASVLRLRHWLWLFSLVTQCNNISSTLRKNMIE